MANINYSLNGDIIKYNSADNFFSSLSDNSYYGLQKEETNPSPDLLILLGAALVGSHYLKKFLTKPFSRRNKNLSDFVKEEI